MPKKKKVSKISYETKMSKRKGKVRWLVIERPTGSIIAEEVFEDEAKKLGYLKSEGKDYIVEDGDMIHFRYNV